MVVALLALVAAYLVGAIPFGWLIARSRGVDIFHAGSGNIGATNIGRILGRKFGLLVFALDFAKGAVPVAVAGALPAPPPWAALWVCACPPSPTQGGPPWSRWRGPGPPRFAMPSVCRIRYPSAWPCVAFWVTCSRSTSGSAAARASPPGRAQSS